MTAIYIQYRILLPYTLEEYNICQLYMASKHALEESKGEVSIKVVTNERYVHALLQDCQHTVKKMDIANKLPMLVRKVMPCKSALHFVETSFNAYPRCSTTYRSEFFKEEKFLVTVNSVHLQGVVDMKENVLDVPMEIWKKTSFIDINIADKSSLEADWHVTGDVVMTAMKHVSIVVNLFGFGWLTSNVRDSLTGVFQSAHQKGFSEKDEWQGMSLEDIRKMEEDVKAQLDEINAVEDEEN